MSEYIITTEQIEEAAEYTPPFKTLSYVAKYKISGDLDMQGIVVYGLPEIVRCRDCEHYCKNDLCKEGNEFTPECWRTVEPDGFCKWGERA